MKLCSWALPTPNTHTLNTNRESEPLDGKTGFGKLTAAEIIVCVIQGIIFHRVPVISSWPCGLPIYLLVVSIVCSILNKAKYLHGVFSPFSGERDCQERFMFLQPRCLSPHSLPCSCLAEVFIRNSSRAVKAIKDLRVKKLKVSTVAARPLRPLNRSILVDSHRLAVCTRSIQNIYTASVLCEPVLLQMFNQSVIWFVNLIMVITDSKKPRKEILFFLQDFLCLLVKPEPKRKKP